MRSNHCAEPIKLFARVVASFVLVSMIAGCAAQKPPGPPPDEQGRQLLNAPHAMSAESMEEIRRAIPKFGSLSDARIMQFMHAMGPNYTWYISDKGLNKSVGVLLLGHGFREQGDKVFSERVQPLAAQKPTALALGMSMATSEHIQLALDNLERAGAKDIVVVPIISTRHNTMQRQWDYIFGRQDMPEYASVPQVRSRAKLHFVTPLEDHPLVGDTLIEYAAELSFEPANEELVIVAHGPVLEADNQAQLQMLQGLADYVDAGSDYAAIHVVTLQDDASPEIRRAKVLALRGIVRSATTRGRNVLIVTSLLGTRVVQSSLRRDLRGLAYRFNPKGLMEHDNFIRWIDQSVEESIAAF